MDQPGQPHERPSNRDPIALLLAELREDGRLAQLLAGVAPSLLPHASEARPVAGDILRGAAEIAAFLYGDARHRRKVYSLVGSGHLPHFRLGVSICSRKSVLLAWISAQEGCATGSA